MTSTDHRDIIGGMLMLVIGVFIILYVQRYDIGSLANMGPGYFPMALGILLSILGCMIFVPAFFRKGTPISVNWRGYLLIIGSLMFYALTLRALGLLISTGLAVFMSSMASPLLGLKGRIILVMSVVGVTYIVFMLGLNMRLPLWPSVI